MQTIKLICITVLTTISTDNYMYSVHHKAEGKVIIRTSSLVSSSSEVLASSTSSGGPSTVILSSPSVNSMCTCPRNVVSKYSLASFLSLHHFSITYFFLHINFVYFHIIYSTVFLTFTGTTRNCIKFNVCHTYHQTMTYLGQILGDLPYIDALFANDESVQPRWSTHLGYHDTVRLQQPPTMSLQWFSSFISVPSRLRTQEPERQRVAWAHL